MSSSSLPLKKGIVKWLTSGVKIYKVVSLVDLVACDLRCCGVTRCKMRRCPTYTDSRLPFLL